MVKELSIYNLSFVHLFMLIKSQLTFYDQTHSQGIRYRRHITPNLSANRSCIVSSFIALLSSIVQSASR